MPCHQDRLHDDGPALGEDEIFYRTGGGVAPEPQDFRHDDSEVIMAEYVTGRTQGIFPTPNCIVKGVTLADRTHHTYVAESLVHNECEGIFPGGDYICLESSCDTDWPHYPPRDLWKLKLDGSQQRVRMTSMPADHTWKATNSNVSPDGRWLAYMVALNSDEAGFGRGLGLLDLDAWGNTEAAQAWETPTDRAEQARR